MCYIWIKTIESYAKLNKGKFDVINEIETKLPVKGFTIEHKLSEEVYQYKELTKVEKNVPIIIIIITVIIIILLIIQKTYCFS